jgi:hypothetical protein
VVTSTSPMCADFVCPEWWDAAMPSRCDPCCQHDCMGGANCSYYFAHCVDGGWRLSYTPC